LGEALTAAAEAAASKPNQEPQQAESSSGQLLQPWHAAPASEPALGLASELLSINPVKVEIADPSCLRRHEEELRIKPYACVLFSP
jgi:hypothetical protein